MSFFSFGTKAETDLTAEEFKAKMDADPKAELLDVRTAGEYAEGAIENAKNIDFFSSNFRAQMENLPKDKTYFVYCRSGNRSGQAVKFLKNLGCEAFNLDGGIMSWPY
jgi:rhodanese-related sulfurtransferase